MKFRKTPLLSLVLVCGLAFGMFALAFPKQKGFALSKVRSPLKKSAQWEVAPLLEVEHEELRQILAQDFKYLSAGAQCYAFLSGDGKYVLKFFKMKHFLPKRWLKYVPLPGLEKYRFRKVQRRILRQKALFSSYKMAYEELKDETGTVYIHLSKSSDLKVAAKLFDRTGKCSVAQLDQFEFVLQEKAQLFLDRINALMHEQRDDEAAEAISALLNAVANQCKRGFIDHDSGIGHNYGFVGDRVIHFDVGRIAYDETAKAPSCYQREIVRVGKKLEEWLIVHYPELLPSLELQINQILENES